MMAWKECWILVSYPHLRSKERQLNDSQRLDEAKANIKLAQEKQKEVYDHKHANPTAYQVLKKDFNRKKKGGQMDAKYVGPFVISKNLGKGLYALQSIENPGHVLDRVNGVHLKPYLMPPPSPSEDL